MMNRFSKVTRGRVRRLIAIALTAFCLASGPSLVAQQPPAALSGVIAKLQAGTEPVRVVCFGDSITGVYYHTGSQRAWTDLLGIALQKQWPAARLEMHNAGISGHTTAQGLGRMVRDVLSKKPHLVVVMFGMNDVVRVPLRDYEANLARIADQCRAAGAAVVFCTPNSVVESPDRTNAKLAEYAAAMRRVAAGRGWPLADAFADWESLRQRDPDAWTLLMSEAIHPNLNGQRRFAELMAGAIAGGTVTLSDAEAPPAPDPLRQTRARIAAGQPVKIVAMPPYDRLVRERILARHPDARVDVIVWPVSGPSAGTATWDEAARTACKGLAKQIREIKPDLVVVAPPAWVNAGATDAAYMTDAQWMLNFAFPFATRQWDVIAAMPTVAEPGAAMDEKRAGWWRRMILGKDLTPLDRASVDDRPVERLLDEVLFAP